MRFREGISVGTQPGGRALPVSPRYENEGPGMSPGPSSFALQRYTSRRCPIRTTWMTSTESITS